MSQVSRLSQGISPKTGVNQPVANQRRTPRQPRPKCVRPCAAANFLRCGVRPRFERIGSALEAATARTYSVDWYTLMASNWLTFAYIPGVLETDGREVSRREVRAGGKCLPADSGGGSKVARSRERLQ